MKPILLVDNQGETPYAHCNLERWVDEGVVDFRETIDCVDHIDPDSYATAFVHQSNQDEYEWAKRQFNPVFFFSGGRVSEPYSKRHMVFMSRRFFLEHLPRVIERYEGSGEVSIDMFVIQDGGGSSPAATINERNKSECAITFIDSEEHPEDDLTFPIRETGGTDTTDIDFVATLRPLTEVNEPTPIFLKETYSTPRDGLELLLRIRVGAGLGGEFSKFPIYIQLESSLDELLHHNTKYAVLCTRGVHIIDSFPDPNKIAVDILKPYELDAILDQLPIRPDPQTDHHDLSNAWGALRLWRGYQLLRSEDNTMPEKLVRHREKLLQREYYAYLAARSRLNRQEGAEKHAGDSGVADWQHFLKHHCDEKTGPLRILLLDDEAEKQRS